MAAVLSPVAGTTGDVVNTVGDVAGSLTSFVIDLQKENLGGIFSNLTLLSMLLASITDGRIPLLLKPEFEEEYDFVIIGGGSAGCVMASRLSEIPCVSVLLLEAGGEAPLLTEIPPYSRLFFNSPIDWAYRTVPQKNAAFNQKNNKVILNNGKTLGGSSRINAMFYVRGNNRNYDNWVKEGATGWGYDDVLPYFLKLENNRDFEKLDPGYHETDGPLHAERVNYESEMKKPVLKAAREMGYEELDINGRRQTGMFDLQMTAKHQQRNSADIAYLEMTKATHRKNLKVITHAFVRKILFTDELYDGERKAYAVEFDHKGKTHIVRARREVIVSNGGIRTPQTLILSGIGPKEELEKHNITPVVYLSVGKNLMDHYASLIVYEVSPIVQPIIVKLANPINILQYITTRTGVYCSPAVTSLLAFLDGINTTANSIDFPMQELYFTEYATMDPLLTMNIKKDVWEEVYAPYLFSTTWVCFSSLLQPFTRGEITLNSTDPYEMPLINPRYYEDERDLKVVMEGLKICNRIFEHPELSEKLKVKPLKKYRSGYPGCEEYDGNEDDFLSCIARSLISTVWHYSGTARMGARGDPRSVVDPDLKVIGVKGLRVVNAAIFPIIPSANTNVLTMMVAEKISDKMKQEIVCPATTEAPKESTTKNS